MTAPAARTLPAAALEEFITRSLGAVGMPESDARITAALMVEADLLGSDAHGIFRLPQYVRRIREGGINLAPSIRVLRETAATALLDGDNAMGHLVVKRAADLLAKGNVFIAVGALHLPGEDGLVELIRKAGYKVTPVN